jgi:hypothetical protein
MQEAAQAFAHFFPQPGQAPVEQKKEPGTGRLTGLFRALIFSPYYCLAGAAGAGAATGWAGAATPDLVL